MSELSAAVSADASNLMASFQASASVYERRLGGSTRTVAAHLASLLSPRLPPNAVVLDNACGTGAFTDELLKVSSDDLHIHAVDLSPSMIEIVQSMVNKRQGWKGRADATVMDGQHLRFPDGSFDAGVINFGISFFPDPIAGIAELYRTLKPGGMGMVTCWKEQQYVHIFYEVQKIVDPPTPVEMTMVEKWRKRETLEETLRQGGFANITETKSKEVMLVQDGFNELVETLTMDLRERVGQGWTEEDRNRIPEVLREVLMEQRTQFLVEGREGVEGDKVGLRMEVWIALVTK